MRPSTDRRRTARSRMRDGADAVLRARRRTLVPLAAAAAVLVLPGVAGAATVSGTAFEDFNDNGVRDSAPVFDAGVGGIAVTAYGPGGAVLASSTTAADGSYSLNVPDPAARVRLEFTGLPAGYQPARHGARSGTTVQFVDLSGGDATGIDVGVLQPANFCQDNPQLAVACMQFGARDGDHAGDTALRLVADATADNEPPVGGGSQGRLPGEVAGATYAQIGSVFGVANVQGSGFAYSSAYTKRHADWGPGGAGAIYRTDVGQANAGTPNATLFFDVNSLPSRPAGSATRGTNGWVRDSDSFDAVGTTGLGNLVANGDGSALFTVGLGSRELIQVPIPADGSTPTGARTFAIPSPCAVPGDARPMGLGFDKPGNVLYVGGVCSEASRGDPAPRAASADLSIYVYAFDPATGTFSSAPVLDVPLPADRLCTWRSAARPFPDPACGVASATWHPWTRTFTATPSYAQPMLSDIAIVGDDLVLGFRDRWPDQIGANSLSPDGSTAENGVQSGYALRACASGGGFALESNGVCGDVTAGGWRGIADVGPGDGLFYWDQDYNHNPVVPPQGAHDYTGVGGLLQIPGAVSLRQTAQDAANVCPAGMATNTCPTAEGPNSSAGVLYLSNSDGSRDKGYNLYTQDGTSPATATFGKSNGLGDLEALCDAAPIEIGNYVWFDANRDGVQDPDETPVADVVVELLDAAGNVIATTRTDASGQYWFDESNVPGAIQPHTDYTVRIPLDQPALEGWTPTADHTSDALRDSNGVVSGRYVIDPLRTGAAGHNDHTHDFGFFWFNVSIRKAVSSPTAKIGDTITYTLTARNDGPSWATDVVVTDTLPRQLELTGATTSQGTCTTAGNALRCELGTLRPGQVETVTVTAVVHRSGTIVNTAVIRSPGDRDPSDNEDPEEVRVPEPDLSIVKRASAATVQLGQTFTYTLTARNNGPGVARDVVVRDRVPAQLAVVSTRTPVGTCATSRATVRCELGALAEGQAVPVTITVRAVRTGRTVNVGIVEVPPTPEEPNPPRDPNPRNDRDAARVVVRRVTLGLTKTVNRRVLRAGQRATFTIKVRNPSRRATLRNVRTCDRLPAGLAFVKATPKAKLSKGRYCWTAKTLKPRQSKAYRITVRALNGSGGKRVNRATATARDANTRRAKRAVRVIGGAVSPAGGVTG
ncbi:SdrD B-like domain-containing protein [Conexibacter arvalis]|uniref:Putative repeat protein (TIGR01451 family) n=1 Tax=Conexibacter arvalis TaxID=912552 RepID=A0A840IJ74_9ACTN|nr:SdrD B-like domain-containing protein [Conexibacter arvalis]MBB4664233.1 putative repeat protein (TIGR01451 family) [Conexibacter arvalis]